ncbi:MAG: type I-E CRISPR-associated protein Cse2/CasB [Lactobacillus sp.]|jgi:CRISPR system Cascade subunit CasB|nr:type I-E CRISPR-associated protein Cse2/CasB [Lactobacillus sp.]MCI1974255.1 type I-E CRISPR-associated protein Cse2/CasB [Lactobacillus sp.]
MNQKIARSVASMLVRLDNNDSGSRAMLANLRGCSSITDRKATIVWPLIFENIEMDCLSKNGQPTFAEKAVFSVLKLYAIYRQGSSMDTSYSSSLAKEQPGLTFFGALAELRKNEQIRDALDHRIQAVLASTNYDVAINGMYHLMQILHSHLPNMKIDFAQLASDLYSYQFSFENARSVCLRWGKQYFVLAAYKEVKENNND